MICIGYTMLYNIPFLTGLLNADYHKVRLHCPQSQLHHLLQHYKIMGTLINWETYNPLTLLHKVHLTIKKFKSYSEYMGYSNMMRVKMR